MVNREHNISLQKESIRKSFFILSKTWRHELQKKRKNEINLLTKTFEKRITKLIKEKKRNINIMVYQELPSEVPIGEIIGQAKLPLNRINFYIPQIRGNKLKVCLHSYADVPKKNSSKLHKIRRKHSKKYLHKSKLDLVVVPGLFVDSKGSRLGRGKGYYDRFLRSIAIKNRICIFFSWQFLCADLDSRNLPLHSYAVANNAMLEGWGKMEPNLGLAIKRHQEMLDLPNSTQKPLLPRETFDCSIKRVMVCDRVFRL